MPEAPRVAVAHSHAFRAHAAAAGEGHPERPDRSDAAIAGAERLGARVGRLEVRPASRESIERVHHPRYVDEVAATASAKGPVAFDDDTIADATTWDTARLAAGAAIAAVDALFDGTATRTFALVRPPGHHAEVDRAMGFCFFGNVAIAAQHALDVLGCRRVAVVDWDVHHGNGTQRAFDGNPDVLFVSSHQPKLFPPEGGHHRERGRGAGVGTTLNLPLGGEAGDDDLLRLHERITAPVLEAFRPDVVIVSAGFDAHVDDAAGRQRVTARGFGRLASLLCRVADRACEGRVAFVLEGGYHLGALTDSVEAVLAAALDPAAFAEPAAPPDVLAAALLDAQVEVHKPSWPTLR